MIDDGVGVGGRAGSAQRSDREVSVDEVSVNVICEGGGEGEGVGAAAAQSSLGDDLDSVGVKGVGIVKVAGVVGENGGELGERVRGGFTVLTVSGVIGIVGGGVGVGVVVMEGRCFLSSAIFQSGLPHLVQESDFLLLLLLVVSRGAVQFWGAQGIVIFVIGCRCKGEGGRGCCCRFVVLL